MKLKAFFTAACVAMTLTGGAVTLEDCTLGARLPRGIGEVTPALDGNSYYVMSDGGDKIYRMSYATGDTLGVVMDTRAMSLTVTAFDGYKMSDDESKVLLWNDREPIYRYSFRAAYYVLSLRDGVFTSVADGKQEIAVLSPDASRVAYVQDCNIYVRNLHDGTVTAVTTDGEPTVITNGVPDWVYQEEFGMLTSLRWSPSGDTLAFIRWDEREVPMTWVTLYQGACAARDEYALYPGRYDFKYPVAGETNATVSVHTWNVVAGVTRVDVPLDSDGYVPQLTYAPDGRLMVSTLNRLQNHWHIYAVSDGVVTPIYEESSGTWVDISRAGGPRYYDDRIIIPSDRDGYTALYRLDLQGKHLSRLTTGTDEVTTFYGYDKQHDRYLYQRSDGVIGRVVEQLDRKSKVKRLGKAGGTSSAQFSRNFTRMIERYSNVTTPDEYIVRDKAGKQLRVVEDNSEYAARWTGVPRREFFTMTTERDDTLNGYMIKPVDFDTTKKYPVIMSQYSGPGSQEVLNRWLIDWENYAATVGYVVVCVDGRGTGCRGKAWRAAVYRNLGLLETEDQISAARYVAAQPWADESRIAIYGWSYGGFEALMAMSQGENSPYCAGVSIAPVTSWRFYDSIYTERFMGLPADNAEGYDRSPLSLVDNLHGNLLLMFGSADDNVQIVNEMQYIAELNDRGVMVDMMVYPNMNHSINGCDIRATLYRRVLQFLDRQ